jgi:hypothetical protein
MKKIYILLLSAAAIFASCTDLKEEILDEQDGSLVVSNSKNVGMIVAPSYAYLRDLQSRSGVWLAIETCTDEVAFPTRGANWNSADYRTLFTHDYDPLNGYIKNAWNSFMIGMTKCNVSLQNLAKLEQTDEVKTYTAEVRFIRALCMYHLNDLFGQFPFREYTEYDYSKLPTILDRKAAVTRIETELKDIIPQLKFKGDVPYGRITRAAAQMLLAKLYLNNQVYTGTAPEFKDGQARWKDVIDICDEIIGTKKYTLADDFWKLYLADNAAYSNQTETVLPIIYNSAAGIGGTAWTNQTLGYNQTFGTYTSLWNGCCTTPTFFDTWDQTDPRFRDDRLISKTGFNLGFLVGQQYNTKGEMVKTKTGIPLAFTKDFSIQNSAEEAGIRVIKYAPDAATAYPGSSENDFQYYRLTDVYLMRAEAKMRNGDTPGALSDINEVRLARKFKQIDASELSLDKIYNERGFEFYWEGSRRNDMVRFNKYCEARYEKNSVTPTYKILFPIPSSALEANPKLEQNPQYNK